MQVLELLGDEARATIGRAIQIGFTYSHNRTGTEHILLSIAERDNYGRLALYSQDTQIARKIENQVAKLYNSLDEETRLATRPLDANACSALEASKRHWIARGKKGPIDSADILYAITDNPSPALTILEKLQINTDTVLRQIDHILHYYFP